MDENRRNSIVGIAVKGLFGQYDFSLGSYANKPFDAQLVLLYGDNGSGKTTILRLLYHILSPEPNRSHRSALTRFPVRSFSVQLIDGTEVAMERPEAIVGAYRWVLRRPFLDEHSVDVVPDPDGVVRRDSSSGKGNDWDAIEAEVGKLSLRLYYLPHHRRPELEHGGEVGIDIDEVGYNVVRSVDGKTKVRQSSGTALEVAVFGLQQALQGQALAAAQTGEHNINQIYSSIVDRILWSQGTTQVSTATQGAALVSSLASLAVRNEPFSYLGLTSRLDFSELLPRIENQSEGVRALVASVMEPYIDSVTARLDALSSTRELIDAVVRLLNDFYARKRVSFDLKHGLKITQSNGEPLPLDALSSGEKQLMLLVCSTVRARARSTIFIVDEPELSLNVKWQRRLLESLLTLVKGSNVQFVIATHSIEMLAGRRDAIAQLDPSLGSGAHETWKSEQSPS